MSDSDFGKLPQLELEFVEEVPPKKGKPRGFAAMPPEQVRAISSAGGKAAHAKGTAHEFTKDEAKAAGRKGGIESHRRKREWVNGTRFFPGARGESFDFVTFACGQCGEPQTQAVRLKARNVKCVRCAEKHHVEREERRVTIPKG